MSRIIGIAPTVTNDVYGCRASYMDYFAHYGSPILIDPYHLQKVDLLVMPGGGDVLATRYDGDKMAPYKAGAASQVSEYFDKHKLPVYLGNGTPIFGICRGLQSLNVLFGGKLKRHLRRHARSVTRDHLVHPVTPTDTFYTSILGYNTAEQIQAWDNEYSEEDGVWVNSIHHQAIYNKNYLSPDFLPLAVTKSGIIEAAMHKDAAKKIAGVQWHPEEIGCPITDSIINYLIS